MYDEEDDETTPDNEKAEGEPVRRTGGPTERGGTDSGIRTMSATAAPAAGGGMAAGRWGGGLGAMGGMQGGQRPGMGHGGGMMGGGMHQRPDWGAILQRFQDRFAQRLPPWLQGGAQGMPQGMPFQRPQVPPQGAPAPAPGAVLGGGQMTQPPWLQEQLAAAARRFAPQQGQEPGGGIVPRGWGQR